MRVAMISKALVVGAYQRKAEEIARLGIELTVLMPDGWRDRRGHQPAERCHTTGYELRILPLCCNGSYHLHFYPTLYRELRRLRPHVVHVDEEPYNLATWLGLGAARRVGAAGTFFTWQNLHHRYPPPFSWMEQANYRRAPIAIAGNTEAAEILRRKGYRGEVALIPQFGVDPAIFRPVPENRDPDGGAARPGGNPLGPPSGTLPPFRIGYAGGLLPEKGVDLLLRACAGLRGAWQLAIVGSGEMREDLARLARTLHIDRHVRLGERLASDQMPDFYRSLDALVLPSRTLAHWKEQFGRVLIEAMACGVPVIGSDSGEIPNVIGLAGLIFPEGDAAGLRQRLQFLMDVPEERRRLGQAGRRRALERYTMAQVAHSTVTVYAELDHRRTA